MRSPTYTSQKPLPQGSSLQIFPAESAPLLSSKFIAHDFPSISVSFSVADCVLSWRRHSVFHTCVLKPSSLPAAGSQKTSLPTLLVFSQELINRPLSSLLSLFLKPFLNATKNPKGNPMFPVATLEAAISYIVSWRRCKAKSPLKLPAPCDTWFPDRKTANQWPGALPAGPVASCQSQGPETYF